MPAEAHDHNRALPHPQPCTMPAWCWSQGLCVCILDRSAPALTGACLARSTATHTASRGPCTRQLSAPMPTHTRHTSRPSSRLQGPPTSSQAKSAPQIQHPKTQDSSSQGQVCTTNPTPPNPGLQLSGPRLYHKPNTPKSEAQQVPADAGSCTRSATGMYLAALVAAHDTHILCWQWSGAHLQAQACLGAPCFSLLPHPAAARCWSVASPRQLHAASLGHSDHSFDLTNLVQPVSPLLEPHRPCCSTPPSGCYFFDTTNPVQPVGPLLLPLSQLHPPGAGVGAGP